MSDDLERLIMLHRKAARAFDAANEIAGKRNRELARILRAGPPGTGAHLARLLRISTQRVFVLARKGEK